MHDRHDDAEDTLLRNRSSVALSADGNTALIGGKEGNKLIERLTGEVTDPGAYRNDYGPRGDPWKA